MKRNKGFTLIELLVVIAIIGILSSVVLSSLSSARDKGKDTSVKSTLASMRAQAELYASTHDDSFANICTAIASSNGFGPTVLGGTTGGLLVALQESVGVTATIQSTGTAVGAYDKITCRSDENSWVVEAPLVASTGATDMYCVDSLGASKTRTTFLPVTVLACPTP
ncbi:MAG: type II secretion system protein [Candidatus Paceibacterota bacterium]